MSRLFAIVAIVFLLGLGAYLVLSLPYDIEDADSVSRVSSKVVDLKCETIKGGSRSRIWIITIDGPFEFVLGGVRCDEVAQMSPDANVNVWVDDYRRVWQVKLGDTALMSYEEQRQIYNGYLAIVAFIPTVAGLIFLLRKIGLVGKQLPW